MTSNLRARVLEALDVEKFYSEVGDLELTDAGADWLALCPFHEDSKPSLSIRKLDGVFVCFGCDAKGSVFDFYARGNKVDFDAALDVVREFAGVAEAVRRPAEVVEDDEEKGPPEPLDPADVERWHNALMKDEPRLSAFKKARGLKDDSIRKFKLGYDGQRITIPVYDETGALANVRRYLPNAPKGVSKVIGLRGHNGRRLLLCNVFGRGSPIVLCEGEMDTIIADQEGLNATTITSGAGNWLPVWNALFTGERVIITYDRDDQGFKGTDKVGRNLAPTATEVRVVAWPEDWPVGKDRKDVTDFIKERGADAYKALLLAAPLFEPTLSDAERFPLTDLGNAERLVSAHGEYMLYFNPRKSFWVWNGKSKWDEDRTSQVPRWRNEVVRSMGTDAAKMSGAEGRTLSKWHISSEGNSHLTAMVARAGELVSVAGDEFNRDPYILNTPTGVLDLRTLQSIPATKEQFLSLVTGVGFDPDAKSEAWQRFLDQSTGGDKDLEHFLQKAVGYSLTGDTREEVLFFVHGPTATGKSTFLEAVKSALGDYAATVDVEAFLAKRFSSGGPSPELAKLRWKRMVVSIEIDEGKHLAEGLIKLITGGDVISVRDLYRSSEEYKPEFKIWLAANNRPRVSDVDDAIWRRILVIPFTVQVPADQRDKTLKGRLSGSESSAILAWAIRGAVLWQGEGLGKPPRRVAEALQAYQDEVDPIKPWVEDATKEAGQKFYTPQGDLYQSYNSWAKRQGIRNPMTELSFAARLDNHEYERDKVNGTKVRRGILLIDDKRKEPTF